MLPVCPILTHAAAAIKDHGHTNINYQLARAAHYQCSKRQNLNYILHQHLLALNSFSNASDSPTRSCRKPFTASHVVRTQKFVQKQVLVTLTALFDTHLQQILCTMNLVISANNRDDTIITVIIWISD